MSQNTITKNKTSQFFKKLTKILALTFAGTLIIAIIGAIILRIFFLSFVDVHELGFVYNKVSGEITQLERTGYFLYPPWFYSVHAIDLRPIQLSITANSFGNTMSGQDINQRVLNAKLVQFNPNGLDTFVEWHGREAGDSRQRLGEILRCYAFNRAEGRDCPFITILEEIEAPSTEDMIHADNMQKGKL